MGHYVNKKCPTYIRDGFEFGRDGFGDTLGTGRNGSFLRVGTGGTGLSAFDAYHVLLTY